MIDSHAHIVAEQFDADRSEVIRRATEAGVAWIEVGTTLEDSRRCIQYPHASVGVHPNELDHLSKKGWEELSTFADHPHVCAIGEVGLDFSRDGKLDMQEVALRRFIRLAREKRLPVIFHVRSGNGIDAHAELIRILQEAPIAGVIHTFSGTLAQAEAYIALGMMISFSGVITFKNAGELPSIARTIPLDRILVETDCPYLTPEPYRGQRNEMIYVRYVIEKIADLRGVPFEEIDRATEENSKRLFNFK